MCDVNILMTGGIVQLVAKGKEDNVLTDVPQITQFKTVYRRHTNFDKEECTLNFNNKLSFGATASCKIKKLADLVSRLTLVIELPTIDISYLPLTNQQLAILLAEYGMTWIYDSENATDLITLNDFNQVVGQIGYVSGKLTRTTNGMINDQIDNLTRQVQKDDAFTTTIKTITQQYHDEGNTNVSEYIDDLMLDLLLTNRNLFLDDDNAYAQDYYNQYYYLHSYKHDLAALTPREVLWFDTPNFVISFIDPIDGIPISPSAATRYISASTDRGWIANNIYIYINNTWNASYPITYNGVHMTNGLCHISANLLYSTNGLNKTIIGFFDDAGSQPTPPNPQIGDTYIYSGNSNLYIKNYIYAWNGSTWIETIPSIGNAFYVTDIGISLPNFYRQFIYYNGTDWLAYSPSIILLYNGTSWHRSIYAIYDPTDGLPQITVPDSLSRIYISADTANGWTKNYLYVWDGWEWNEIIPSSGLIMYIENGEIFGNNIITYNGLKWSLISLEVPLYNFDTFRNIVYTYLRKIIYTDSNVNILCGVERCNTIVIPSTSIQLIRPFFDSIVTNAVGTIDTNAAVYKLVYNTFFDSSFVGNQEHVDAVQTSLSAAIHNCMTTIINPDIEMLTMLYNRLVHNVSTLDYFQLIYYKQYPYNSTTLQFDKTKAIVNCSRDNYLLTYANRNDVWDYFTGYIMHTPSNAIYVTDYTTYIQNQTLLLCGNTTTQTTGTMYNITQDSRIQSFFNDFFTYSYDPDEQQHDKRATVLISITAPSTQGIIYNIALCMNNMSGSIADNISNDYKNMWLGLGAIFPSDILAVWQARLLDDINKIRTNIIPVTPEEFADPIFTGINGSISTQMLSNNDRAVTFIFQRYTTYTIMDLLYNQLLPFTNKNPIEYVVLSFSETLKADINSISTQPNTQYYLTPTQRQLLCQHIDNLADAYLDVGLLDYSSFAINDTNILESNVPELFYTGVDPITSYHYPYDGITSMTCYLLNQMKNTYNAYYQTVTSQSIYDNIGNPLMTINDEFITSSDFYVYGNDMYVNGNDIITSIIDIYNNDLIRYDKYGAILQLKNLYLDVITNKFAYPIDIYVEMQKVIYNDQSIYVGSTTYGELYSTIIDPLNIQLLPLLSEDNANSNTSAIYIGPMDTLIESLQQRIQNLQMNPYDEINDNVRYKWYDTHIIFNTYQSTILSFYDPTTGTPSQPAFGDVHIASNTAHGWTKNYIYKWTGSVWAETIPTIGNIAYVIGGSLYPNLNVYYYGSYWSPIGQAVLQIETDFDPKEVGIIEYFMSTIESSTNPFEPILNLYQWYEGINHTEPTVQYEINKMNYLFGLPYYSTNSANSNAITPQSLYNDLGNINSSYNSFSTIVDFINYLMAHVIAISPLGNITSLFTQSIDTTAIALISYYQNEKSTCLELIDKINPYTLKSINGSIKYSTLEDIIRNIYNKKSVNFAWIKELGHYIIENAQLLIDDEIIDQHSGEYMHITASLECPSEQLDGYNKMIGNVPKLYTYDSSTKYAYTMYVPLLFTPSKFYNASLPLVCMQHANVSVKIKLRQLSDVAYWAPMTKFNKKPKINCTMVADYIYVDHDERMRMATSAHDILIEPIYYNGDICINLSSEIDTTVRLCFAGASKELFVVCQMDEYINGSMVNGEKQWNNYLVAVPKNYQMINGVYTTTTEYVCPIDTMRILFNGREREASKDVLWYSCVGRYAHHTVSAYDGICMYSFALNPEELQPSGNANTGIIGYVELYITFRKDVLALVGKQKKTMRIGVYNKSINILRVRSGMAGLAFYQ